MQSFAAGASEVAGARFSLTNGVTHDEDRRTTMKKAKKQTRAVEGEGSYTATRAYNANLAKSVNAGHSEELGEKASKAVDGPEGDSLREAERTGKAGHAR